MDTFFSTIFNKDNLPILKILIGFIVMKILQNILKAIEKGEMSIKRALCIASIPLFCWLCASSWIDASLDKQHPILSPIYSICCFFFFDFNKK